jgi:CheY-like chemotaxis protein
MKTLLVFGPDPVLPDTVRAGLDPENYRVLHRATLEDAEPFLTQGLADVCILDLELTGVQSIWVLERIRRRAPKCPVIVYAGRKQPEWEEEAYLQGASQVLTKPVRGRLLKTVLERLGPAQATVPPPPPLAPQVALEFSRSLQVPADAPSIAGAAQPLSVLKDFSSILTHSLDAEAMLQRFLLLMRELLSINRAAIFLSVLKDFSSILTHSLDAEAMLQRVGQDA